MNPVASPTSLAPMRQTIYQRAKELGFDDCRFTTAAPPASAKNFQHWLADQRHGEMEWLERNAAKRTDPELVLPGGRSVITLATSYAMPGADSVSCETITPPAGEVARYARFTDYHQVLAERLKSLTISINEVGGAGTRSVWYVDTGPLLERDLAQRAGLGFVGKHTNLISRSLGNWIFLAEILTTLELGASAPEKNRCGSCNRCLAACPTDAITAPFHLDARRCISYLTIELKGAIPMHFRPLIGNRIYGCDDCLAACPWNRFAREGGLMKPHARTDLSTPNLVELLKLDGKGFKARFAGTPLLRTKRRGLLRNVCVALGNVGDEACLPALKRAALDDEPLIVEHARWATEQIQMRLKQSRPISLTVS